MKNCTFTQARFERDVSCEMQIFLWNLCPIWGGAGGRGGPAGNFRFCTQWQTLKYEVNLHQIQNNGWLLCPWTSRGETGRQFRPMHQIGNRNGYLLYGILKENHTRAHQKVTKKWKAAAKNVFLFDAFGFILGAAGWLAGLVGRLVAAGCPQVAFFFHFGGFRPPRCAFYHSKMQYFKKSMFFQTFFCTRATLRKSSSRVGESSIWNFSRWIILTFLQKA